MKILVVIDMQNDFTSGVLGNERCNAVVNKIENLISGKNYDKIIFTRDTHQSNYLKTQEGRKLPVEHCIENSQGWQIRPELLDVAYQCYDDNNIIFLDKPSFGSIELSNILKSTVKNEGCDEIYFCGVCTGICVISNVAITKAALPETNVFVIENACACVTEDSHKTAIAAMKTFQVDVI